MCRSLDQASIRIPSRSGFVSRMCRLVLQEHCHSHISALEARMQHRGAAHAHLYNAHISTHTHATSPRSLPTPATTALPPPQLCQPPPPFRSPPSDVLAFCGGEQGLTCFISTENTTGRPFHTLRRDGLRHACYYCDTAAIPDFASTC